MQHLTPVNMAALHARAFTDLRPWTRVEFASLMDSPLVFACGDMTAFALGRVVLDEAELLTLVTDPDQQRNGLGAARLAAYHKAAQKRGAVTGFLEVAADNHPAIALYTRAGYTRTGLRKAYYTTLSGGSVDAVIMSRALATP